MTHTLSIRNLKVVVDKKEVVRNISLVVKSAEMHVVMGPNGSGKSSFTYALCGHPLYSITAGYIKMGNTDITAKIAYERARLGILLAFQNPIAVPGVSLFSLLRMAYQELHKNETFSVLDFHKNVRNNAQKLGLDDSFLKRSINDGFSGGEKKKVEMLQLLILKPKFAIFDEIDTGLDVDALKLVSKGIDLLQKEGCGIVLITHYQRILNFLHPGHVHVMVQGSFVAEGGMELVKHIEEKGYANIYRSS